MGFRGKGVQILNSNTNKEVMKSDFFRNKLKGEENKQQGCRKKDVLRRIKIRCKDTVCDLSVKLLVMCVYRVHAEECRKSS